MAETIRSALLVDYESLHRSLSTAGIGDTRLADRTAALIEALARGQFPGQSGPRRRIVARKCYAGPGVRGKQRDTINAAGIEVVDLTGNDGGPGQADVRLTVDVMDSLSQPGGPDEFILLTASPEIGPVVRRLKAGHKAVIIYADDATPAALKALADAAIDRAALADFLASDEEPPSEERTAQAATDRAEIEAFARRIHAATNIPLFSPRTFAELFRHLVDEIRENGYHFQTTARHVAARLSEAGRNVTRRQVVFIVKGLALKGHVFSTSDTPEGLADVFREQARYLITNAGLTLDDQQERLLQAWFLSRASAPSPGKRPTPPKPTSVQPAPPKPQPPRMSNGATEQEPQARNGAPSAPPPRAPAAPREEARPATPMAAKPPPSPPPPQQRAEAPPKRAPQPSKPAPIPAIDLPRSAARPTASTKVAPPSASAREEAKAVIAARIAASAKLRPSKGGSASRPAARKPAPAVPDQPAPSQSTRPQKQTDAEPDALESSILAAIAEAVDVLVESGAHEEAEDDAPAARRQPPEARHDDVASEPAFESEVGDEPEPDDGSDAEGGDIGDQIQRIIASYNRNRGDE